MNLCVQTCSVCGCVHETLRRRVSSRCKTFPIPRFHTTPAACGAGLAFLPPGETGGSFIECFSIMQHLVHTVSSWGEQVLKMYFYVEEFGLNGSDSTINCLN